MRVLIDANVPIRAPLPSDNPARAVTIIRAAALARAVVPLPPPGVLADPSDTRETRPNLVRRIPIEEKQAFLARPTAVGIDLPPSLGPSSPSVRDPDDDLLACARRDRADDLVTRDRDPLDLAPAFAAPHLLAPGAFVRVPRDHGLVAR